MTSEEAIRRLNCIRSELYDVSEKVDTMPGEGAWTEEIYAMRVWIGRIIFDELIKGDRVIDERQKEDPA